MQKRVLSKKYIVFNLDVTFSLYYTTIANEYYVYTFNISYLIAFLLYTTPSLSKNPIINISPSLAEVDFEMQ
jgi:hypothetical protein